MKCVSLNIGGVVVVGSWQLAEYEGVMCKDSAAVRMVGQTENEKITSLCTTSLSEVTRSGWKQAILADTCS